MPSVYINALLQACLPVALRAALPVHINSTTGHHWLVCVLELSWHAGTDGLSGTAQGNIGTVRWGDRAGRVVSPKLRTQVTRCGTFRRSIATDHMKWRPLPYRSPSHQPRQAIAPAQYYNLQCVSLLRATLQFVRNAVNAACVQSITISLIFQRFVSNLCPWNR
jgi:hypothetical protein